jgi:hypothetical protein
VNLLITGIGWIVITTLHGVYGQLSRQTSSEKRSLGMDVQMLLDYIGSLDSETAQQIIERFEQAKADSADSWILDGDCWRANND